MISRRSRFVSLSFIWISTLLITAGCQTSGVHELLPYRPTDYEEIERRLEAGANPNARNHEGRTLLWRAALRGDERLVRILIDYGADPTYPLRVKLGETALHAAALQGQNEVIKILLAEGVDVDILSRSGITPLHLAARWHQVSTVRLLLDRGADPNIRDKNGKGPLDGIGSSDRGDTYLELVKLLVASGVPADQQAALGRTPLFDACLAGNEEVVEFLLNQGANPNHIDRSGRTPLMMAAFRCNVQILHQLLAAGADPTTEDKEGKTALTIATDRGHIDAIRVLETR